MPGWAPSKKLSPSEETLRFLFKEPPISWGDELNTENKSMYSVMSDCKACEGSRAVL